MEFVKISHNGHVEFCVPKGCLIIKDGGTGYEFVLAWCANPDEINKNPCKACPREDCIHQGRDFS